MAAGHMDDELERDLAAVETAWGAVLFPVWPWGSHLFFAAPAAAEADFWELPCAGRRCETRGQN